MSPREGATCPILALHPIISPSFFKQSGCRCNSGLYGVTLPDEANTGPLEYKRLAFDLAGPEVSYGLCASAFSPMTREEVRGGGR